MGYAPGVWQGIKGEPEQAQAAETAKGKQAVTEAAVPPGEKGSNAQSNAPSAAADATADASGPELLLAMLMCRYRSGSAVARVLQERVGHWGDAVARSGAHVALHFAGSSGLAEEMEELLAKSACSARDFAACRATVEAAGAAYRAHLTADDPSV